MNKRSATPYLLAAALALQLPLSAAYAQDDRDATAPRSSDTTRSDTPDTSKHSDMGSATKNLNADSFAKQAAVIAKAEIELGQLALESSKDENVRKFAQKMVTDHTASAAKLKAAAKKDNVSLPEALDAKHKATKEKLASLSGAAFDREYVKAMSKGHDEALALFESASQSTQVSTDLKQFASSSLPTLREHRELAHSLHSEKGG